MQYPRKREQVSSSSISARDVQGRVKRGATAGKKKNQTEKSVISANAVFQLPEMGWQVQQR